MVGRRVRLAKERCSMRYAYARYTAHVKLYSALAQGMLCGEGAGRGRQGCGGRA